MKQPVDCRRQAVDADVLTSRLLETIKEQVSYGDVVKSSSLRRVTISADEFGLRCAIGIGAPK